jgi:predicted nuclease with TOPRIM domain
MKLINSLFTVQWKPTNHALHTISTKDDLIKRVEILESGAQFDANRDEIRRIQMEHLQQLHEIRNAMLLVMNNNVDSATEMSPLAATMKSSQELERLKSENAILKVKCEKQAYRIQQLVTSLEELLSKQS